MVYMNIKCGCCGGSWTVFEYEEYTTDWRLRTCPHCKAKVDEQVWDNTVIQAFGWCRDTEAELVKQHTGYHTPLFSVDIRSNSIPKNDDTAALNELVEAVRSVERKVLKSKHNKRRKRHEQI